MRGWLWALDYAYAGRRQVAILATPWTTGRPRRAPRPWRSGSDELAEIILLPGVYEHWSFLRPLGNALNAAGHRVSVVHGLGTNRRGIVETSERLGRALTNRPPPTAGRVLVAHSKGGLIGKHLLVSSGAAAAAVLEAATGGSPADAAATATAPAGVDATAEGASIAGQDTAEADTAEPHTATPLGLLGLVAICTPFRGSPLAGMFFVPSIRAFLPDDETIVMLGREESVNGRIVSIFGRFDPHIPGGSALDGATNVIVPASGHFRVLGSPDTHAAVLDGVRMLSAR